MNWRFNSVASLALSILLLLPGCATAPVVSGDGGTDFPNTRTVIGVLYSPGGIPASRSRVTLASKSYNTVTERLTNPPLVDTTDDKGRYCFFPADSGEYAITAVNIDVRTRAMINGIHVGKDTTLVAAVQLTMPGKIIVNLPDDSGSPERYAYIPGTSIAATAPAGSDSVVLDSVPSGMVPSVNYGKMSDTAEQIVRYDIPVVSGETTIVRNPLWNHAKPVYFNTTPSGAAVAADVTGFPVLIRLSSENFTFGQAQTSGKDVRFAKNDGTPLAHEIEIWDSANAVAAIWVRIDTLYGNNSSQHMIMYWGASASAISGSNSTQVFDTAAGFLGVWHLGDAIDDSAFDATSNRYHGISPATTRPMTVQGIIGMCQAFDGVDDYITIPNTAAGKLDFPEDGDYSIYAWVLPDSFDNTTHPIVAKGGAQYCLQFGNMSVNSPVWEFVEFGETSNWQVSTAPSAGREWTLLVGVRQGNSQRLYCNGELVDSVATEWPQTFSRNTSDDLSFGRFKNVLAFPAGNNFSFFKGSIDEVRVIGAAENPDRIRLCYMNQRIDNRLVEFK